MGILNTTLGKVCIVSVICTALFMWLGWGIRGSHTVTAKSCHEVATPKGSIQNLCTVYTVQFDNVSGLKPSDMDAMADKIISAMQAIQEAK